MNKHDIEIKKYNHQEIISSCLARWQVEDNRTKYFTEIFESWISHIPVSNYDFIFHLLSCFSYYPHEIVNKLLSELHKKLKSNIDISDENTIYLTIKSEDGIGNSSNDYWIKYRLINGINHYCFVDDIHKITELDSIDNFVFIDDCSGSGRTFIKYIENNKVIFANKNIYFVTVHIMTIASEMIINYANTNGLNIEIIFAYEQNKAFDHEYFKENPDYKDDFITLSKNLRIRENHILGFENTEGLFAFFNNTPNNTLGIFRYDIGTYSSLFPRNDDKVPDWLRKQRSKRKMQNYKLRESGVPNVRL